MDDRTVLLADWILLNKTPAYLADLDDRLAANELDVESYIEEMLTVFLSGMQIAERVARQILGDDRTTTVIRDASDDVALGQVPPSPKIATFRAGARWAVEHQVPNLAALSLALVAVDADVTTLPLPDPKAAVQELVAAIVREWTADLEFAIDQGRRSADPLEYVLRYVRGDMGQRVAQAVTTRHVVPEGEP